MEEALDLSFDRLLVMMMMMMMMMMIYSVYVCVCVCVTLYHANNVSVEKRECTTFFKLVHKIAKSYVMSVSLSSFFFGPSVRTEQVSSQ